MLNRTREYVDDAPVSRTSKPIGFYITTPAIDALAAKFGQYLEKISPDCKCLMGAVFFDQLGGGCPTYTMRESLGCIDPDSLLGDDLSDFVIRIANEDSNDAIVLLISAVAAYVADDIRNDRE